MGVVVAGRTSSPDAVDDGWLDVVDVCLVVDVDDWVEPLV